MEPGARTAVASGVQGGPGEVRAGSRGRVQSRPCAASVLC